ncbi:MAG TPA: hypothetical protein EYH54_01845 [Nautiliaceae bacterium]|nr:hypothetical protein [Nautiliaceae bacterium]
MKLFKIIKVYFKEVGIYAPLWVYLTFTGPFFNELINTGAFLERRFLKEKRKKKYSVPIFLIPGTLGGRGTLVILKKRLRKYFRDVFTFKPKRFELVGLEENITRLNLFIDTKMKMIKAQKLILIGHSQGGIIARRWMNIFDPQGKKTLAIITLGSPHSGSWAPLLVLPFMWWARAVWQLIPPFTKNLNETPSIKRTISIIGKYDLLLFSYPWKSKVKEEIETEGAHLFYIYEKKIFYLIMSILKAYLDDLEKKR